MSVEQKPLQIVLGVTGSVAAFKAASLASELVKAGRTVRVIMTEGGARFVAPLTFEALTGHPVSREVWDEQPGSSRMGHLELARWADLLVVAPASAASLARLAIGSGDDMLGAVALASRAPLLLAPSMETTMWEHPATARNVATLQERGARIVGPESGRLASGEWGVGRMAEPDSILAAIESIFTRPCDLADIPVLVTAGPTFEAIDPVRFIGNRSSGKMGYAVAEEARDRGARVLLITGPTSLPRPPRMQVIEVESAEDMRREVMTHAPDQKVIVMAAAVADFRPSHVPAEKIKRSNDLVLRLVPTEDIAAMAREAAPSALHIGFALESSDLLEGARRKLQRKGLYLVVANLISADHNPFGSDTNRVMFVRSDSVQELPQMSKQAVAQALWDAVEEELRRE